MVRTDIFSRGVPWMLLMKRTGTIETDLNVKADQKACVALTGITCWPLRLHRDPLGGGRRDCRSGRHRCPQSRIFRLSGPSQGIGLCLRRPSLSTWFIIAAAGSRL